MVDIWSVANGTLERAYDVPGSQGNFVLFPGGNIIAIDDPQAARVHVMNIWDGAILKTFPSPIQDEFGGLLAAVSLDGSLFALSAANTPIDVWRIGQDAPLYSLTSPFEWTSLSFSPDGKSLVTASDAVEVRNASDGKLRFRPAGVLTSYNNAMFSPDGTLIVTADQGRIHLWSLSDGSLQHSLEALPPALFTPDSALLIASGEDHIQFWQVSDGVLLRTLEATTLPTVISSDGQILISMRDGVVETWGVPAH
jgi:WD40 repeat protein